MAKTKKNTALKIRQINLEMVDNGLIFSVYHEYDPKQLGDNIRKFVTPEEAVREIAAAVGVDYTELV